MLVATEMLLKDLVKRYGKHPLSTDMVVVEHGTIHRKQACRFLNIEYNHFHSLYMRKIS
jgi:hypothetical protein